MIIRENIDFSTLTTMRLGGTARYVLEVTELADVPKVFDFVKNGGELSDGSVKISAEAGMPYYVLGCGANTIAHDGEFPGAIILNRLKGIEVLDETSEEALVRGMGGEIWDDFAQFCCEREYSGIEAMSGIPGTVGAAPVQNIGAYGQDVAQVLDSVSVYDIETGEVIELSRAEIEMGYRRTTFNSGEKAGRYFIMSVSVLLDNRDFLEPPFYNSLQKYLDEHKITEYTPMNIREAVLAIRGAKLPDPAEIASSGSFFKNIYMDKAQADEFAEKFPEIQIYEKGDKFMVNTGALIEGAGLAGKTMHGMRVLEGAALVLINDSAKKYADLDAARTEIRAAVYEKYGVEIEQEPVEIDF